MQENHILYGGIPLESAHSALILLHGRGATAENIMRLAPGFSLEGFALLAPQADGNSWYPHSFMAPEDQNQPRLDAAMDRLARMEAFLNGKGLRSTNLYLMGFSQGACLALEYAARHAKRFGGVVAFTGGLIGEKLVAGRYPGSLDGTPVFLGTGDPDPHVPLERVQESADILTGMGARVLTRVYAGLGHAICRDETELAGEWVFGRAG